MNRKSILFSIVLFGLYFSSTLCAQLDPGVYFSDKDGVRNELKLTDDYFILSVYKSDPAEFMQTIGGFYSVEDGHIKVDLEFNSDFEKDSIQNIDIPFKATDDLLIFDLDDNLVFQPQKYTEQDLDGAWLFATRGPDSGQERRGEANARKTLKILMDGRFQWVAYHTETMKFSGTGGGSYTADDGIYTEEIEYFSRDNSRVGAKLKFEYNIMDDGWHHTGKNSKGEPMYEIWARR